MRTTRRELLGIGAGTAGAAVFQCTIGTSLFGPGSSVGAAGPDGPVKGPPAEWSIGCFNRPWGRWSFDAALDGINEAGFRILGLLGEHEGDPFLSPQATAPYLDRLKERIEARELVVIIGWLRTVHNVAMQQSIQQARKQVDNARRLGIKYLLTAGVGVPDQYDHYYGVMSDAAAYARERGIQIVLKPHGGCCASAAEMLHCVEKVGQPNFRLWYDAGNIIHYTGKDPTADVERVAHLVTGFCAKDCAKPRGEVMIPFGTGKVDFKGVFTKLKGAGFGGPVMVECCGGQTPSEVTAGARANREFLERLFRSL